MQMLKRVHVAGWKSIRDQTIDFTPLNVIIGANGAGKSNLLSLFKLLNAMLARTPGFRNYVGMNGYASSLLHYGSERTPFLELELTFDTDTGETCYFARWAAASTGALIFTDERVEFQRRDRSESQVVLLEEGHSETGLIQKADDGDRTAHVALQLLRSCRLFHFHDTSENCAARQPCSVEENRFLYLDAGNLAAMLYLFQEKHPTAFRQISATVRQMVPDFDAFALAPSELNPSKILLKWSHKDSDYEFGPHQLSDGSLRFIALVTLLLQPQEKMPLLIALDEPELGLHPAALEVLAGIAKSTSQRTQLVFGTQSATFLDHFEPENVVVVSSKSGESTFQRFDSENLDAWLADYTLGEVWEKNIVGGGPYD
ncbi:MAG: AAA family ATPase [Isosphaeraceae bacterium]